MTSPAELQAAMMAESRRLQSLIDDQPRLVQDESQAIRLRDLAESSAYLATTGTVAERQAHVTKAAIDERYAAHLAEGLRKSNEMAIRGSMQKLSALQSLASAMREEARLARSGDGP